MSIAFGKQTAENCKTMLRRIIMIYENRFLFVVSQWLRINRVGCLNKQGRVANPTFNRPLLLSLGVTLGGPQSDSIFHLRNSLEFNGALEKHIGASLSIARSVSVDFIFGLTEICQQYKATSSRSVEII